MTLGTIEAFLRARRDEGRKLLVPYVTGGLGNDWTDVVEAVAAAGADAIEVGIPFSDPVMDGPVIQEASQRALAAGITPAAIVTALGRVDTGGVPIAVMTYYNLVFRAGHTRFARQLADQGISGAIVPDLPLDELDGWGDAAEEAGIETILLAAPTTPDDRLAAICARTRGWVYGVGIMGVTGERSALATSATLMAKRLKAVTDKPVLIGIGVSTPSQAAEASVDGDGVIVGSALVRRLLEGAGPDGAADFVAALRAGLDSA
ncbi:MAG: tryptophan synthase alpha chain [Actinomycetota bacterium]|jgi:tryptophan synthase alpha chain|nr:tryptophan synthase alpha chain [Actinomycetota bacterium]